MFPQTGTPPPVREIKSDWKENILTYELSAEIDRKNRQFILRSVKFLT